ncbi:MAG: site-specific integrase [Halobacteriales archaeon]|nr:site-specific integrase [Halobacteriales archaeon]
MEEDEAGRFLEAAREDRYYALWAVLLTGGLRPSEALALGWDAVDFEKSRVHVTRSLTRVGVEGWKLVEPKTDASRRGVVLPGVAIDALREWKATQGRERLRVGTEWAGHDAGFVFTTPFGEPLDGSNLLHRNFRSIMERAGLGVPEVRENGEWVPESEAEDPEAARRRRLNPSFRMYDLRHTCATLLLKRGVGAKIVQERLGHASITLTLDTYAHVLPTMQGEAADELEAVFG